MKSKFTKIALAVGFGLAMVLTFSCSDGGGENDSSNVIYGTPETYENKTYKTVIIGTQTWIAENLNFETTSGNSSCYDDNPANCDKYGRLYDWATAMSLDISCNNESCQSQIGTKHRGICPEGWHIPSTNEWRELYNYANCEHNGYKSGGPYCLKATNEWPNCTIGNCSWDTYGFTALPGGSYGGAFSSSDFNGIGSRGYWWTSDESMDNYAYLTEISSNQNPEIAFHRKKKMLFSVRCVKDN